MPVRGAIELFQGERAVWRAAWFDPLLTFGHFIGSQCLGDTSKSGDCCWIWGGCDLIQMRLDVLKKLAQFRDKLKF